MTTTMNKSKLDIVIKEAQADKSSAVWDRFAYWLLMGVIRYAGDKPTKDAILAVAELYQRKINGEIIERAVWRKAAYAVNVISDYSFAAETASCAAFTSTYAGDAAAYAADAGTCAADAAAAAAYAADAAAAAAAAYAAYSAADAARNQQADKLLELLRGGNQNLKGAI